MNNLIKNEDICITGDIHLGNPKFSKARSFYRFMEYLCDNNYNLCVNGDGVDILQLSLSKILTDLPLLLRGLELLSLKGLKVYYVIGNHDVYLEQFLYKWDNIVMVPYLDIALEKRKVHIEHGHLYDKLFINHPSVYENLTIYSGYLLKLSPALYDLFMKARNYLDRIAKSTNNSGDNGSMDKSSLIEAARELTGRGYDVVVFGHSHHVASFIFEGGEEYYNTGCWMGKNSHYIQITGGDLSLKRWDFD